MLSDIVARIARRDRARTEATLQADIRALILSGGLNLTGDQVVDVDSSVDLEAQLGDGTRRRIDIETGSTVIEVKRDLSVGTVMADAKTQLGAYVHMRVSQTGARFLGILTDGRTWQLYVPEPGGSDGLIEAGSPLVVSGADDTQRLVEWLGAILATRERVRPAAERIAQELGADSPAHAADHATLAALLDVGRESSEIALKRRLWSKLLKVAFGSAFDDSEDLFINHTLLVITAEIIAHAVIGYDVSKAGPLGPRELVGGERFEQSLVHGVVEQDFFDWPLDVPGGADFVRSLAHRLSRFDWSDVDHDVLKHLYESIISAEARKSLGEYYTPDWLADRIVTESVDEPATARVLDPACGSGTFLFHAVRRHVETRESLGESPGQAVHSAVDHVFGMDIHPVAVTLARVTYLLAVGRERLLHSDRGEVTIPVFLGDSVQWEERRDLFQAHGTVTVHTSETELVEGAGGTLGDDDLVFPARIIADATAFDDLIRRMAAAAMDTTGTFDRNLIDPILRRAGITDPDEVAMLRETFSTMRALHRTGNDHIWSYYVRNLVRPLWLSQSENRVDVLLGNPPWLRYSDMTPAMQRRYLDLSQGRNLLSGALGASARDLSTLFVVRAIEHYLKPSGRFAFVMPHGVMTRKPHAGFRSGRWEAASARFTTSWDLGPSSRATGFPLPSCVLRGQQASDGSAMASTVERWTVQSSRPDVPWSEVEGSTTRESATVYVLNPDDPEPESAYRKRFRAGAIIYPQVLFFVNRVDAGPLGAGAGRTAIASRRSIKRPWSEVEPLTGVVENQFVHGVRTGETILPYRALAPLDAVVPLDPDGHTRLLSLLEVGRYDALASWWSQVEGTWRTHRRPTERADLIDRVDYSSQLSAQLPAGQHKYRVVYTASGNSLASALLEDETSLIEHKLYWAPVTSRSEGRYLVGILNSEAMRAAVAPMQSVGLFGTRDIDKLVFRVPFPAYDPGTDEHRAIVDLVEEAERVATEVDIAGVRFPQARARVRDAVRESGVSDRLEALIEAVLPTVSI